MLRVEGRRWVERARRRRAPKMARGEGDGERGRENLVEANRYVIIALVLSLLTRRCTALGNPYCSTAGQLSIQEAEGQKVY